MLFYYFPSKEALYRGVLDRWANNMIALHERFRGEPGRGRSKRVRRWHEEEP